MIEHNKTYSFTIPNVSFGLLSESTLDKLFKDGRYVSPFLEEYLPLWFPNLKRIEGNQDHDHVDQNGVHYDAKNFTKNGLQFMPSNQIGAGRKFDAAITEQKANGLIYICCDIVDFPNIRVKFVPGKQLYKSYPNAKIPFAKRDSFFSKKKVLSPKGKIS